MSIKSRSTECRMWGNI